MEINFVVQGSGELDFILVYRNSGEWLVGELDEKEVCVCTDFSTSSCSAKAVACL